ncbi:MAG: hypothetical protein RLZZ381_396 [Cyanobacteriota bacterium]|jgi:hypothetical protein
MKLGVQELCDRYDIKSRKSLYSRLDGLGITLAKDGNKSYGTDEQVKLLDQQDEHIKNGGTIKNFVPTTHAEVTVHNTSPNPGISSIVETTQHTPQLNTQSVLLGDIAKAVSSAIALKMTPPDPLWYLGKLEIARASGWELTTSQVKELIGVKPSCKQGKKTFKRGSFIFVKTGKIGNQTSWKVQKVTDDGYKA